MISEDWLQHLDSLKVELYIYFNYLKELLSHSPQNSEKRQLEQWDLMFCLNVWF